MSEKKPASARFSIDWVASSLFVLVCAGLLILFQYFGSPWPYLQGVLGVAWNHQLVTWQNVTIN